MFFGIYPQRIRNGFKGHSLSSSIKYTRTRTIDTDCLLRRNLLTNCLIKVKLKNEHVSHITNWHVWSYWLSLTFQSVSKKNNNDFVYEQCVWKTTKIRTKLRIPLPAFIKWGHLIDHKHIHAEPSHNLWVTFKLQLLCINCKNFCFSSI